MTVSVVTAARVHISALFVRGVIMGVPATASLFVTKQRGLLVVTMSVTVVVSAFFLLGTAALSVTVVVSVARMLLADGGCRVALFFVSVVS